MEITTIGYMSYMHEGKKKEMTIIAEIYEEKFSLARLAQSVERETLNLNVVGSSPTLGVSFSNIFSFNFCY